MGVENLDNCTGQTPAVVMQAAGESLFPQRGIAVAAQKPYPPNGDAHRIYTLDFTFNGALIVRGGYNFVLCWYPIEEPDWFDPVPQLLGHFQLDGPSGDQVFVRHSGV